MRVTETDLTTLVSSFIDRIYSPNLVYNLQTPGDGTKRIEVFVRDGVNNESNVRSQNVLLDTVLPAVTSVMINGGGAVATSAAVTVAIGASDDRSGLVQYQLSEAADFTGGTTTAWTAWSPTPVYTVSSGDGTKTVYTRVKDVAGNISTEAVLNHDSITLDAAGPTFSSAVSINSGATTTTSAAVSLSISATDAGSSVAEYRLSEASNFSGGTTTSWTTWTGSPQTAAFMLSAGDGAKNVYVQLKDANGNLSTEAAINHDSITLDQSGPTFTSAVVLGAAAAATASTTVSISILATDAGSSVAQYRLSEAEDFTGGTTTTWTAVPLPTTCSLSTGDGAKTIYVQLRDANGNSSTETVLNHDSITLDQAGPTFSSTVVLAGAAVYTGSTTVAISISASDASTSLAHYRLSEAADFTGGTTTAWTAVPLPTTCSLSTGSGVKTIYVQLRDTVGNLSTETTQNHDSITLDQQVPTFSAQVSINGGAALTTNPAVSLSISATDGASGIADYQLSQASDFTGGTTTSWTAWTGSPQTAAFTLSGDGSRTVYTRVRDSVGNVSTDTTLNHDSITLDAAGPAFTSTVSINSGAATTTSTSVSLSISAIDVGSSVAEYRLSEAADFTGVTTTSWTPWTGSPQTAAFTLSTGDGTKNVYVQLKDANGNLSTEATLNHDDIKLDQNAPVFSSQVSINSGAAGTKTATISLAIAATDAGSSIAEYRLSEAADFTGGTTTSWTAWAGSPVPFTLSSGDGTKTVYVRLRDANTHVSTESVLNHDDIVLDTAAPQVVTVTFAADNLSAVVSFDENVYGDAVQGPLGAGALHVVVLSGSAELDSESTALTGPAQATVTVTWKPGKAPVTGDSLAIRAATSTSVYDSVGNAMNAGSGGFRHGEEALVRRSRRQDCRRSEEGPASVGQRCGFLECLPSPAGEAAGRRQPAGCEGRELPGGIARRCSRSSTRPLSGAGSRARRVPPRKAGELPPRLGTPRICTHPPRGPFPGHERQPAWSSRRLSCTLRSRCRGRSLPRREAPRRGQRWASDSPQRSSWAASLLSVQGVRTFYIMKENEVLRAIRTRRSVTRFTEAAVSDEQLESVLEAGRWAPSYINSQPWDFIVVRDHALRARMAEVLKRVTLAWQGFAMAPVLVAVAIDPTRDPSHSVEGGAAAVQNMALAAHSLGLASSWAGLHAADGGKGSVVDRGCCGAPRNEPLSAALGKAVEREQVGVEEAQAELVVRIRGRVDRGRVDDRAHAVAELRGQPARVHVDATQDARVEQAGRTQQHLQVERFVQRESVEHDQRLDAVAAAHVGEARDAVARSGRQPVHGFQRIVCESRQSLDFRLREYRVRIRNLGGERVAACRDDDLLERNGLCRRWFRRHDRRRHFPAHDGVRA